MPANWISHSKRVRVERYTYCFDYPDEPRSGYGFPCKADGTLLIEELTPEGMDSLLFCCFDGQSRFGPMVEIGVRDCSHEYVEPAVIRCDCGKPLTLWDPVTNVCSCNRYYNGCGQALVDPKYW